MNQLAILTYVVSSNQTIIPASESGILGWAAKGLDYEVF